MTIGDSGIGRICKYSELPYASLLLYLVLCVESPLKKRDPWLGRVYLLMLHISWLCHGYTQFLKFFILSNKLGKE